MKTQKTLCKRWLIFPFLILALACSSDDSEDEQDPDGNPDPEYTISDLEATIVENPEAGFILGSLTTDLPGSLTHTLSSDAFAFDPATLEVSVADESVFDYELNTVVSGTITVSNGSESLTATITITLTDFVDVIEGLLTTSRDAYLAAEQGDWIEITAEEFESLEEEMEDVSYSGTSKEDYSFPVLIGTSLGNSDTLGFSITNVTDATMPEGSYLFAIRFFSGSGVFEVTEGNKVRISETGFREGYTAIGNPLPEKTSEDREAFFVLKYNYSPVNTTGYLSMYYAPRNGASRKDSSEAFHFQSGEVEEYVNDPSSGSTYAYQGLSTTTIQWD
ncbi:hypothetical protein [Poritiphilus flavus]|uniref:Cadherin domain-containing protein n=1 Tax=Poritiphilus flavus TaxID=2697053 RepID=A0A6L9EC74_9FLAO|nr:hypothetical protein [Poritiphilus flavus]NAS12009.1 hypothetical protein [Poritiphilus flavus]